jgi:hypothetical protein
MLFYIYNVIKNQNIMGHKVSKTKEELLENTINHFNANNRATDRWGRCQYLTEDGRRCAIGIEVSLKLAKSINQGKTVGNEELFNSLPQRLKDMGQNYLLSIQQLHDSGLNWNETGLSTRGESCVESIKSRHF